MDNSKKEYNRREFLSKTVVGMSSVGMLGASGKAFASSDQNKSPQHSKEEIIYRTLGNTEIRVPIVNMGVMNCMDPAVVKKSYELGVRYFDTAAWYMRGRNEEMVGSVIKELNARDKVIIGTKIYVPHERRGMIPEEAREAYLKIAEESLQRLQTDYVDILFSHSIETTEWLNNPGILEALQLLKKQKKARFIGFTTHSNMAECIQDATQTGVYDVIGTPFNYTLSEDQILLDALKNATAKGIGLIAMKTQCSQYWHPTYRTGVMHTAVLKWALRNDFITTAIPGYINFQEMEEDFSVAYGLEYTPEEKTFLEDKNIKLSLAYCRQCKQCVPTCPAGVDIPTLMRTHMYATCYTNFYQARDALESIPRERGLQACISCKACTASCVNRIHIAERIADLKILYA
jgi:predicted aldo/keto reductase-like oxidoreductase